MTIAQGLYEVLSYKKQSALGTPATGSGGTQLRRETAIINKTKDTYDANEIVSHQMDTGIAYGVSKTAGELNGVISAGSYAPLLGSILRNNFTAVTASSGLSLTISGSGPTFNLNRAAGSFLTDGIKVGNVVRITAGTFTGTASNLNLLVTNVTATTLVVIVPNGKTLTAQGPIASSTVTVVGKTSVVPVTGQTNDYYTFEQWMSDASLSRLYTDVQIASADISIPATGFASIKLALLGLGRTKNATQQLTSPAAASTTAILAAANAKILIAGTQTVVGTSLSLKIDGQLASGDPVIGSNVISDIIKGDIKVSGTFTHLKQDETNSNVFDAETPIAILAVLFADQTDTSDFVGFNISRAKLTKDEIDDGKKMIVATHDFVAEYNPLGSPTQSVDNAIISIQDSQA
jgi:hypothetical protein